MSYQSYAARLLAAFLVSVTFSFNSSASIVVSGNVNVTGNTGTFQLNHDVDFTITAAQGISRIIFDEWAASDGSQTTLTPSGSATLSYQIDHGTVQTVAISGLVDNLASSSFAMTANDGYLALGSSIMASIGQVVTIKAFTMTFNGNNAFNADAIGTFTGNAFLGNSPKRVSSDSSLAAVPEPSAYATCAGLGVLAFAGWRRKVRAGTHTA